MNDVHNCGNLRLPAQRPPLQPRGPASVTQRAVHLTARVRARIVALTRSYCKTIAVGPRGTPPVASVSWAALPRLLDLEAEPEPDPAVRLLFAWVKVEQDLKIEVVVFAQGNAER